MAGYRDHRDFDSPEQRDRIRAARRSEKENIAQVSQELDAGALPDVDPLSDADFHPLGMTVDRRRSGMVDPDLPTNSFESRTYSFVKGMNVSNEFVASIGNMMEDMDKLQSKIREGDDSRQKHMDHVGRAHGFLEEEPEEEPKPVHDPRQLRLF